MWLPRTGENLFPLQGSKIPQGRPPPARNYGARDSGGDAYAMGKAVNIELTVAWQWWREIQHSDFWSGTTKAVAKECVRILCRIRHAGRVSA